MQKKGNTVVAAAFCALLCMLQQLHAQTSPIVNPLSNSVNILYDRTVLSVSDESYLIDGDEVLGFPFLYYGWNNGTVTTGDGKMFSNFKLKYNIYNQTVFFSDGKDSLEASGPIRQFTLVIPGAQKTQTCTFVNAEMFGKATGTQYYEVLADSDGWELLRLNRKAVKPIHNGLPVQQGRKAFYIETAAFLYNKQQKKLIPVKSDWQRMASSLKLSDEEKSQLHINNIDFGKEQDLLNFFGELSRVKAH
jgi:hypothetical protein